MIFNMVSGGGAGVNFKIVGGTERPASASENTIWVNTSVDITGYVFAAEQPAESYEGLVWIQTGTASGVAFNGLKKNVVQIYPLSAMQHVGDSWQAVVAQSYIDGEWADWWNGELYTPGNTYDGWMEVEMGLNAGAPQKGSLAVTQTDTSMKVEQMTYAAGKAYVYKKKLDLSRYTMLTFDGILSTVTTQSPQSASINIWSELGAYQTDNLVASMNYNAADKSIPLAGINQSCYIGIFLWNTSSYADITSLKLQ